MKGQHLLTFFAVDTTCDPKKGVDPNTCLPTVIAGSGQLQEILTIVLGIFGAIAVLIIVIAGLKFVTSGGNPQSVSKARSTILYAIIGLIVIIASQAIVAFTLGDRKSVV